MTKEAVNLKQNYFEVFGLSAGSDLDKQQLRAAYMALQRQFHPDRFAGSDDRERRYAIQIAAFVNEAYETLSEPLPRAEYWLRLQGGSTDSETSAKMDPMFLMEQMEWREALESVTPQSEKPFDQLDALRRELQQSGAELKQTVGGHLQAERVEEARDGIRKWQFIEKLLREVNATEATIEESL